MHERNRKYIPVSDQYAQHKRTLVVIKSSKYKRPRQLNPMIRNENKLYYLKLVDIVTKESEQLINNSNNTTRQTQKIMDYIFDDDNNVVEDYKDTNCIDIDDIINNVSVFYQDDTLYIGEGNNQYIYELEADEDLEEKIQNCIIIQRDGSQPENQDISDSNTERIRYEYTDESWRESQKNYQNSFFSDLPQIESDRSNNSIQDEFDIDMWRQQQYEMSEDAFMLIAQ